VIVRVPEKKESGRKANRNPAHGIQKIEITVYGANLPRAPNVTVCRPLECFGPSQIATVGFQEIFVGSEDLVEMLGVDFLLAFEDEFYVSARLHAGGVYDDPDGELDGLARPHVLTGGYDRAGKVTNALQCHFLSIHVRTI
jgi:hypothetical protein